MGVQVGSILGLDILILAEPLQPPAFAETMAHLRSYFKPRYEDVSFGAVANAIRHLRAGGVLAITCDRDIQKNGTPLPFFGTVTRMPLGAVELAQRTGAALIPGYCKRSERGFDIYFEAPIELCDTGKPKVDAVTNAAQPPRSCRVVDHPGPGSVDGAGAHLEAHTNRATGRKGRDANR